MRWLRLAGIVGCLWSGQGWAQSPSLAERFPSLSWYQGKVSSFSPRELQRFLVGAQTQLFHHPETLHLSDLRDVELSALFVLAVQESARRSLLDKASQTWFEVSAAYVLWRLGERFNRDEDLRFSFVDEAWREQLAPLEPLVRSGALLGSPWFESALLNLGKTQPLEPAQLRQLAQWSLSHEPHQGVVLLSRLLIEQPEHTLALATCRALKALKHPEVEARLTRLQEELTPHYVGLNDSFARCEEEATLHAPRPGLEGEIRQALSRQEYARALQLARRWTQETPHHPEAWVYLGELAYQRERWPLLRSTLKAAADAKVTHPRLSELEALLALTHTPPDLSFLSRLPKDVQPALRTRALLAQALTTPTESAALNAEYARLATQKTPESTRLAAFIKLSQGHTQEAIATLLSAKGEDAQRVRALLDAAWLQLELILASSHDTQATLELETFRRHLGELSPRVGARESALGAELGLLRLHLELLSAQWQQTPLEPSRAQALLVDSAPYLLAFSAEKTPHLLSSLYTLRATLHLTLAQVSQALTAFQHARAFAPPEVEATLSWLTSALLTEPHTQSLSCRRVQEYALPPAWKRYTEDCHQGWSGMVEAKPQPLRAFPLRIGGATLGVTLQHGAPLSLTLDLRAGFYWLPKLLSSDESSR